MSSFIRKISLLSVVLLAAILAYSQTNYTPYDELPSINKLEKPTFSENYPEWAKKLYKYPVNFYEVCNEYNAWISASPVKKNAIIRYFKNWKTAIEPYVLNDGTIVIPEKKALIKENKEALLKVNLRKKSTSANHSNWTFLGPKETIWRNTGKNPQKVGKEAPWQANVYSFDIAASDHNILYCGTETGFVNKTTDNGLNWHICGQNYHFGNGVTATAIHPTNPDIVYVSAGGQIHKTTDGGTTWKPMLTEYNSFKASRLRIDPGNPDKIIAATSSGIFISTNGGVTWANRWNKPTWDIEIKPGNSNIIYGISSAKKDYFELVISKDGGNSFSKDAAFPSNIKNKSGGLISVTPANANIIYVSLLVDETTDATTYIYKGTYNNNKWIWTRTKRGDPRSEVGLGGFSTGQGYFDFVFEASPDNENVVFWGTCSLYKSTDGAKNFTKIGGYGGKFATHPDNQDIKLLPDGKMWVSTDGGMNYSTDYFTETDNFHTRIKGIVGSHMWGFDQGWNEDIVVGGRYHNGNTAITDAYSNQALRLGGGEAPTGWILKGKSHQAAFSDINKGYTTSIPATIDEVVKNKKYLFSKLPNMKSYGARRSNLLQHPNYYSVMYVGEGTGFWKSSDMGATWDLLQNFSGDVMFMEISHKNPNVIYADVEGKGLYRSEDGGESWTYKPSLTEKYGEKAWAGNIHFVLSPYNENTIYATPQKRAQSWEAKVFKSTDGGTTWDDWSGSISTEEYSKCLVIQPTKTGDDLVYLFITSQKNIADAIGKVYYRKAGMTNWERFDNNYPAGMTTIMALPFYRDSKIRVAGKGGIWESPMEEPDFEPIINPWINVPVSKCTLDTLQLDDHSMLNHEGVSWEWEISPEPQYISNPNIRNPKIVPGAVGNYNVKLKVKIGDTNYAKSIENMFSCSSCPSVNDCSNPAELDKSQWSLIYVDSQEPDRLGKYAFDNDNSTFWHTEWRSSQPAHPHKLEIDLGKSYNIHQIGIINRPTGTNGRIEDYKIYLSDDKNNWGTAVRSGTLENIQAPAPIKFSNPPSGRYLKIVALSEVNDKNFTSIAEINIVGCYANGTDAQVIKTEKEVKAFPVPTNGVVNIAVPTSRELNYQIISITGEVVKNGYIENTSSYYSFNLKTLQPGVYIIHMSDKAGISFRAKVIKK